MLPNSAGRVFKAGLTGIEAGPFRALPWKWSYSTVEGSTCSMFIGGERDWGIHQTAGALNAMETACSDYRGTVLVPDAGHWVQQEAPDQVLELLLAFMNGRNSESNPREF
jgi:pimeloyl-ACP methyl ester carboxylesterase